MPRRPQLRGDGEPNSIGGAREVNALLLPHPHAEEVRYAGDLQHLDHGRVLRVAAGLQAAVRGSSGEARVPPARGRLDQRRGLSRALADQRPQRSGRDRLAQAAGQSVRGRPRRRRSDRVRPRRPRDAGAAISFRRRAPTARRRRQVQSALHVDHEHAAAAVPQAHLGPEHRSVENRLYRPYRLGQFRSPILDAVQPGPAGDPPAGGKGQRAAGHAADQLQGRAFRYRQGHRHSPPAAGRYRGDPIRSR